MKKYSKPNILLLDLEEKVKIALKSEGYNISTGSFGNPYKVPRSDQFRPVIINGDLPHDYAEQEILVIDMSTSTILEKPIGEKHISEGELDWWASCNTGEIDPRPRLMAEVQNCSDKILSHGGVFIVFADERNYKKLEFARIDSYNRFVSEGAIPYDNWSFLSALSAAKLDVKNDYGKEIIVEDSPLSKILSEYFHNGKYECTLDTRWYSDESWTTLAKNKYDATVACVIFPEEKGAIFIFPQPSDKSDFLIRLFNEVLPAVFPYLFPEVEKLSWVQRPEYELPKILDLKRDILQIEENAKKEILLLEDLIEGERKSLSYLYELISETGDPLVTAVKKAFEVLGFQSVVNIDEELEGSEEKIYKHEDLQIRDGSPLLLVEVKGITHLPNDETALTVWKYVTPRMKTYQRFDISGLSIVNHERHLPPLERNNEKPFRDLILENAQEHKVGLLTTWDLFRLTRSYLANGWKHENVKDLFYQSGRIEPIPTHYQFIGTIHGFIEKKAVVGIRLEEELKRGERIAFELPVEFIEQDIETLEVDNNEVEKAESGVIVGTKTKLIKEQAKKEVRVFRILNHIENHA